ncbi:hypothetical protein LSTR_LSTR000255 [Laodelphax striatellus]|uniref:Uncharacterized protein n=1 Tax=Laodelphax striatellus TaxID=195883 RepID=A0A482X891_LAOST|nr:hypothetical protein LSTR_LSTR000255 [Laodelphax striatellus]
MDFVNEPLTEVVFVSWVERVLRLLLAPATTQSHEKMRWFGMQGGNKESNNRTNPRGAGESPGTWLLRSKELVLACFSVLRPAEPSHLIPSPPLIGHSYLQRLNDKFSVALNNSVASQEFAIQVGRLNRERTLHTIITEMINCKTLIIFTSIVFLTAESRPFGDLLRTLINGHLFHPHTRIVDHHHYYTDDIHRRNDHVQGPHYYYEGYPYPPHGELLHRVHSDHQPGFVICCRVNPLKPHYKKPPTSPSVHHSAGHLEHHGHAGGVNHNHHVAAGLHTSVIYHGHGSGPESFPHVHHVVNCDHHQKEHDDKHHEEHNDKHHESHDDEHHVDHSDEHHDKHHEDHSGEHNNKHHESHSGVHHEGHDDKHHHESGEHHDNKNYENQDKHHGEHDSDEHNKDHSEEHHNDEHHDSNTSANDESKINEKPSYEVFENVSDVPKESSSNTNVNEISKKSEDNIVL